MTDNPTPEALRIWREALEHYIASGYPEHAARIITDAMEADKAQIRQALPLAIAHALYGPNFDPFTNPEAFDFCETAARAALENTNDQG